MVRIIGLILEQIERLAALEFLDAMHRPQRHSYLSCYLELLSRQEHYGLSCTKKQRKYGTSSIEVYQCMPLDTPPTGERTRSAVASAA